jgi:hypothetical protein
MSEPSNAELAEELRQRAMIESLRASNAAKDTRIIRLKIERDAYLTALNKAAPDKARELAMRFEERETA